MISPPPNRKLGWPLREVVPPPSRHIDAVARWHPPRQRRELDPPHGVKADRAGGGRVAVAIAAAYAAALGVEWGVAEDRGVGAVRLDVMPSGEWIRLGRVHTLGQWPRRIARIRVWQRNAVVYMRTASMEPVLNRVPPALVNRVRRGTDGKAVTTYVRGVGLSHAESIGILLSALEAEGRLQ